ncbi:MAG TPA: type II toxin-antitoxin system VapC family toxin [Solirubrobacteraceae bacterium]|nr:type II toxin-antitoxin system VapC family toxin [Solirubrobacteraceae bacterium]
MNVLIHAFRADSSRHQQIRPWLDDVVASDAAFGVPDLVLSGFLRIVTNRRAFKEPDDLDDALEFAEQLRSYPNAVRIAPGQRHWSIFTRLCRVTGASGNTVPDAYIAAIAIESGSELITADRGFARFPKLNWRDPVEQL